MTVQQVKLRDLLCLWKFLDQEWYIGSVLF